MSLNIKDRIGVIIRDPGQKLLKELRENKDKMAKGKVWLVKASDGCIHPETKEEGGACVCAICGQVLIP